MKYYIHKDKTVEFSGTNPVLTEIELINICAKLAEMDDTEEAYKGFHSWGLSRDETRQSEQDTHDRRESVRESIELSAREW
jgi:hypothetical protein